MSAVALQKSNFEKLLREAQDIVHRYDFCDARLEYMLTSSVVASSATAIRQRVRNDSACGVRVLNNGRWGFAAQRGGIGIASLVKSAGRLADMLPDSDREASLAPVTVLRTEDATFPTRIEFDEAHLEQFLDDARSELNHQFRVTGISQGGLRAVVNSEGTCAVRASHHSRLTLIAEGATRKSTRHIPVSIGATGGCAATVQSELVRKLPEARRLLMELKGARVAPHWCGPVVLGPGMAGLMIHEAFGHLCEADRVPASRVHQFRLDVRIGSDSLHIWDQADFPSACGSIPFDDEGVPCLSVPLVRGGHWVGMLHTRETAALWNTSACGNARVTAADKPPLCRMRVTEVKSGRDSPEDLVSSVSEGIYLDRPYAGHVRGTTVTLMAQVAWRIASGKLSEPLAGAILHGEPLTLLREIEGIGTDQKLADDIARCNRGDQRDLPVSIVSPTLLLREGHVSPW